MPKAHIEEKLTFVTDEQCNHESKGSWAGKELNKHVYMSWLSGWDRHITYQDHVQYGKEHREYASIYRRQYEEV